MNLWNSEKSEGYSLQPYITPSFDFMPTNFNHSAQGLGQVICFPFFINMPSLYEI